MERALITPAVASDAAAVTEVVSALEASLYGASAYGAGRPRGRVGGVDIERDTLVVRDADRIVGYAAVRNRGELWWVEGYVHPDHLGKGIGGLIVTALEEEAARGGAHRIHNAVIEADAAAARLLESLSAARTCASSASCVSTSARRRRRPTGRTGCASSRSSRTVRHTSSTRAPGGLLRPLGLHAA